MGNWQVVTLASEAIHIQVMKTIGETSRVKFSMKYGSSNLKHGSFDLYEKYPVLYWFSQTGNEHG
jgi:hypothetical protein